MTTYSGPGECGPVAMQQSDAMDAESDSPVRVNGSNQAARVLSAGYKSVPSAAGRRCPSLPSATFYHSPPCGLTMSGEAWQSFVINGGRCLAATKTTWPHAGIPAITLSSHF